MSRSCDQGALSTCHDRSTDRSRDSELLPALPLPLLCSAASLLSGFHRPTSRTFSVSSPLIVSHQVICLRAQGRCCSDRPASPGLHCSSLVSSLVPSARCRGLSGGRLEPLECAMLRYPPADRSWCDIWKDAYICHKQMGGDEADKMADRQTDSRASQRISAAPLLLTFAAPAVAPCRSHRLSGAASTLQCAAAAHR